MFVRRVTLHNIRGFKDMGLQLSAVDTGMPGCALLIGQNGTGKSSLLRSIVLGLASDAEASALLAEPFGSPFITHGEHLGTIHLELVNQFNQLSQAYSVQKEIVKGPGGEEFTKSSESLPPDVTLRNTLVVALGAGRSNEGAESGPSTYSLVNSTYMLFNYEGTFVQPELTLRRLMDFVGQTKYDALLKQIKRALGLRDSHALSLSKGGGVVVSGPQDGREIPLHAWADGYRVTLNWILDIYAWAMRAQGAIDGEGQVHGILLIDEIEQHLHPRMQRGVFKSLKNLFPNLQIIATTHSPLVIQGVSADELFSLHRPQTEISLAPLRDYSGFSVEDLLTAEELFETPPFPKEIEDYRMEYRRLVSKQSLTTEERDQLAMLGQQLARLRILSPLHEAETFEAWEGRMTESTND